MSKILISSDFDAFKGADNVLTGSITFSGTLAGGGYQAKEVSLSGLTSPDMYQIFFDHSINHSGKFRSFSLENGQSLIYETTSPSYLTVLLSLKASADQITIRGEVVNAYSINVALQTTTLNFRYIPYEATF